LRSRAVTWGSVLSAQSLETQQLPSSEFRGIFRVDTGNNHNFHGGSRLKANTGTFGSEVRLRYGQDRLHSIDHSRSASAWIGLPLNEKRDHSAIFRDPRPRSTRLVLTNNLKLHYRSDTEFLRLGGARRRRLTVPRCRLLCRARGGNACLRLTAKAQWARYWPRAVAF
jgi:hypothetical protein